MTARRFLRLWIRFVVVAALLAVNGGAPMQHVLAGEQPCHLAGSHGDHPGERPGNGDGHGNHPGDPGATHSDCPCCLAKAGALPGRSDAGVLHHASLGSAAWLPVDNQTRPYGSPLSIHPARAPPVPV